MTSVPRSFRCRYTVSPYTFPHSRTMSVAPGARLGPYEILSALGAGCMGEVYKARDTRLDRTVAVKILPDALAADAQFREGSTAKPARFLS
jgi:serine/threonine protein kinase